MIISALGFHISAEGGRVAVLRDRNPKLRSKFGKFVGFLAEDKKSILDPRGAVVGRLRHGDFLERV